MWLSMTLYLDYKTKRSDQSSDIIQDALKINYPLAPYTGILLISVQRRERCLNQMRQSKRSFTPFVLLTDVDYVRKRMQCRQDSGSDCKFYLLLTQCDTRIQRDQVLAVSDWTPEGGAYGEKTICWCLALEAVFMQMFVPPWCHPAP